LVELVAKIPGSSSVEPPAIVECEEFHIRFLQAGVKSAKANDILIVVKTVRDAVARLLQFEWVADREDMKRVLTTIVARAEGTLDKTIRPS